MRNKTLEVTNQSDILDIISRCDTIRVALFDEGYPYIVPMNFGEECIDDQIIFYIHTGFKGKKIDLINANPNIGFEMDCNHELYYREANKSCNFRYESIIGTGTIEVLSDDQKDHALTLLMAHYHADPVPYNPRFVSMTNCLKITVNTITAKRALPQERIPDYKVMPFKGHQE